MKNKRRRKMWFWLLFPKGYKRLNIEHWKQIFIRDRWLYFGISPTFNVRLREYNRARNKLSGHHRI